MAYYSCVELLSINTQDLNWVLFRTRVFLSWKQHESPWGTERARERVEYTVLRQITVTHSHRRREKQVEVTIRVLKAKTRHKWLLISLALSAVLFSLHHLRSCLNTANSRSGWYHWSRWMTLLLVIYHSLFTIYYNVTSCKKHTHVDIWVHNQVTGRRTRFKNKNHRLQEWFKWMVKSKYPNIPARRDLVFVFHLFISRLG